MALCLDTFHNTLNGTLYQGIISSSSYNHVEESPKEILSLFLPCILRLRACSSPVSLSTCSCKPAILRSDSAFCSFCLLPKAILASRSVWQSEPIPLSDLYIAYVPYLLYHQHSVTTILQVVTPFYFLKKVIFCSSLQYRSALVVARMRNIVFINLCLAYG